MNGKFDEKLAQLAFGDLSPKEAARVETVTETDPEAALALVRYRKMKGDLALLQDIPEDQLSAERLRHAILAQGLKPTRKSAPSWGWLWMPAAACVLAFGLMMVRPRPHGDPQIVLNAPAASKIYGDVALTPKHREPASPIAKDRTLNLKQPILADNSEENRTRSWDAFDRFAHRRLATRHSRKRNDPDEDALSTEYMLDPTGWDGQPSVGAPQKAAAGVTPTQVASNNSASNSDAPLVLIDQEKDSATGANTATEVGSASNVLVGG